MTSINLDSWAGAAIFVGSIAFAFLARFTVDRLEPSWRRLRARFGRRCPLCDSLLVGPLGGRYCPSWLLHLARLEKVRTTLEATRDRHPANVTPAAPFEAIAGVELSDTLEEGPGGYEQYLLRFWRQ